MKFATKTSARHGRDISLQELQPSLTLHSGILLWPLPQSDWKMNHISNVASRGEQTVSTTRTIGCIEHRTINNIRHHCAGFSLLEVLIASTVFSLGLAGLAALLLASISGSAAARRMGMASMAAASLAEQIRLNPAALHRYMEPPEYVSQLCEGANQCTAEQQADYDFKRWQLDLSDNIPGARGMVCHDATPQDGVFDNNQCDGSGAVAIKIFWRGPGGDDQHTLGLKVN